MRKSTKCCRTHSSAVSVTKRWRWGSKISWRPLAVRRISEEMGGSCRVGKRFPFMFGGEMGELRRLWGCDCGNVRRACGRVVGFCGGIFLFCGRIFGKCRGIFLFCGRIFRKCRGILQHRGRAVFSCGGLLVGAERFVGSIVVEYADFFDFSWLSVNRI